MRGKKREEGAGNGSPPPAIELRNINKSFGAVRANRNVSLRIEKGEIHGIVGENGAGKSTLMNILYGLHPADSGEILIDGAPFSIKRSSDASAAGIGMVHQHFMLVPNFSVLENVMLGSEGTPLLKAAKAETLKLMEQLGHDYGMTVDPHALIEDLPVGTRQRVEIIKAIKGGARVLILDEPTGVLTPSEAEKLFQILQMLKERGTTVILITHKLQEIMAVTDTVSVMRHGELVATRKTSKTSPEELAEIMVGRKVLLQVDRGKSRPGETVLKVENLLCRGTSGVPLLDQVSFEVKAGEILGVAGVAGNGQTQLLEVLTGMRPPDGGTISLFGQIIDAGHSKSAASMKTAGVGHIPEDRHKHGLVMQFEARENSILGSHRNPEFGGRMFQNADAVDQHCRRLMEEFDVRPQDPALRAANFSGGNQQKLVIAREMDTGPKLLIVGQPTRGVDIGAIEFIHKQLVSLRQSGCAILMVSVELEEIFGLSDRIMVMNAGKIVGILPREEANEQKIGLMMAGIASENAA